jgi:hypothetical protein
MRDAIDRAVDVVLKRCEGIVRAETRHKSPVRARILKGIDALRPKPLPIGAARVPIGAHVVRDFEGRKLIGEVVERLERMGCMSVWVKELKFRDKLSAALTRAVNGVAADACGEGAILLWPDDFTESVVEAAMAEAEAVVEQFADPSEINLAAEVD